MPLFSCLQRIPWRGSCGVCRFSDLPMTDEQRAAAYSLCPNARSVGVVLFPYLVREPAAHNLSLYACGRDYHAVIADALRPVCARLSQDFLAYRFIPLADASPLPEVQAAWRAGIGILGKNGLIFDRVYGSFVFIGTILTDLPCTPTPSALETCPGCGACRRACPSGALCAAGTVSTRACLSELTQSKQPLSPEQQDILRRHPLIWGCDICSLVCPLNQDIPETPNPAFREHRISSLTLSDVARLTRKQFLQAYPDRAFTWRGPKPLVRNLSLKEKQ